MINFNMGNTSKHRRRNETALFSKLEKGL